MTLLPFIPFALTMRQQRVVIDKPWVMGILNVTPDSFYADSRCDSANAIETRVRQMLDEGVDVIDIGGYSTRPGANKVAVNDELQRIQKAMQIVRRVAPDVWTSVDTFRASVARFAVEQLGVDIINDVSGGTLDNQMFATVAQLQVPYILMHMRGTPETMQQLTNYDNLVDEVINDIGVKLAHLRKLGVNDVIVDPGFGFGKTLEQNYRLMAHLDEFHSLQAPLLVGVSRKSMIYQLLNTTPEQALNGTVALHTVALMTGAHILRVHDVAPAIQVRDIVAMLNEPPPH